MTFADPSPPYRHSGHIPRPAMEAVKEIWTTAAFLRTAMQDEVRSAALSWAAETFEGALQKEGEALLTVNEAAVVSGAGVGAVRRALTSGALVNIGERYRPRIRRGDLLGWSPPRGREGHAAGAVDGSVERDVDDSRGHALERPVTEQS